MSDMPTFNDFSEKPGNDLEVKFAFCYGPPTF